MDILCIGAAHTDLLARASADLAADSSTPGRLIRASGGVAFNVATRLARLGADVGLMSAVGGDEAASALRRDLYRAHVADWLIETDDPTGAYVALQNQNGDLFAAVADTRALYRLAETTLGDAMRDAAPARAIFLEANLSEAQIDAVLPSNDRLVFADAVSLAKVERLRPALPRIDVLFCNRAEAGRLARREFSDAQSAANALRALGARAAAVTDGARPAALSTDSGVVTATPEPVARQSTNGAGDAHAAGVIRAWLNGDGLAACLAAGLASSNAVLKELK